MPKIKFINVDVCSIEKDGRLFAAVSELFAIIEHPEGARKIHIEPVNFEITSSRAHFLYLRELPSGEYEVAIADQRPRGNDLLFSIVRKYRNKLYSVKREVDG